MESGIKIFLILNGILFCVINLSVCNEYVGGATSSHKTDDLSCFRWYVQQLISANTQLPLDTGNRILFQKQDLNLFGVVSVLYNTLLNCSISILSTYGRHGFCSSS